jgi:uncharacterized protein (TIGR03437 family)
VSVGGLNADIGYNGLAPTLIGLYQINFTVPQDSPTGSVDVIVNSGGVASNVAKLEVR